MINVAKTIIRQNGNYLLVKRAINPKKPFSEQWDLPGGKIEPGEKPEDCAVRETKEETGLSITIDSLILEGDHIENGEQIHYRIYITSRHSGKVKLSKDHTEFVWAPKAKIKDYFSTPFVTEYFARF